MATITSRGGGWISTDGETWTEAPGGAHYELPPTITPTRRAAEMAEEARVLEAATVLAKELLAAEPRYARRLPALADKAALRAGGTPRTAKRLLAILEGR